MISSLSNSKKFILSSLNKLKSLSKAEDKERFRVPIFVSLLILQGNEILLMKRKNTGFMDGFYSTVDGKLRENELPLECAVRTAKEKLDITIIPDWVQFSSTLYCYDPKEVLTQELGLIFQIIYFAGDIKNKAPNKIEELKFFPLEKLPSNIIPSTKHWIQNYIYKVPYVERDLR